MRVGTRMSTTHRSYWGTSGASMPSDSYEWAAEIATV